MPISTNDLLAVQPAGATTPKRATVGALLAQATVPTLEQVMSQSGDTEATSDVDMQFQTAAGVDTLLISADSGDIATTGDVSCTDVTATDVAASGNVEVGGTIKWNTKDSDIVAGPAGFNGSTGEVYGSFVDGGIF